MAIIANYTIANLTKRIKRCTMEEFVITPNEAQHFKKQMDKFMDEKVKDFDLSKLEGLYLGQLFEKDGVSLIDLTNAVHLDKANTTRVVGDLEVKGLVTRKENEKDSRKYKIYLTEKANIYRAKLEQISKELNEKIFKGITKCERRAFGRVLQKILINLNNI